MRSEASNPVQSPTLRQPVQDAHQKTNTSTASAASNAGAIQPLVRSFVPAAVEITLNYPSIYLKNRAQQGGTLPPLSLRAARECYRGFGVSASGVIPSKSAMLATAAEAKKALDQTDIDNNALKRVLAGAAGGGVAALIGSPFELLTIQKQRSGEQTLASLAKTIAAQPIHKGIYRGLAFTAARDSLYSAMILGVAPGVKEQLPEKLRNELLGTLLSATATGVMAAMATQPIDTVKTLVQASNLEKTAPKASSLVAGKSLADLYRGSAFRLYRITQGAMIILGTQELIDKAFDQMAQSADADASLSKPLPIPASLPAGTNSPVTTSPKAPATTAAATPPKHKDSEKAPAKRVPLPA